jgi:hypothetical protein
MSEVKLNLIDSEDILTGTIHGSVGDRCVAALSAEPETIPELEIALKRFEQSDSHFSHFKNRSHFDTKPYDAGVLIIDLAARVVAYESTYSAPGPEGRVAYHNGQNATDIPILYRVPTDWLFLNSIDEYRLSCAERREQRLANPSVDERAILYGRPLLEFLATNVRYALACRDQPKEPVNSNTTEPVLSPFGVIHAQWLLTPRSDLRGQSPRDVMLAKKDFIDSDLNSRAMQWSMQLEGPPCLPVESHAYRYAGFGTHEWVIYYYLIRHLLESVDPTADDDFEALVAQLETLRDTWLNEPSQELEGRIPSIIIDNERRRLPEAMGGRSMVIDEDCPLCKMMGDECEAGLDVCFWHLDSSNLEDHFAFSTFLTEKEYIDDRAEMELRHREFDQQWKMREERIARGEEVDDDEFLDIPTLDDYIPFRVAETEPPEA